MDFLETPFKIFMYVLPYGLCLAAYFWVGKKAWRSKAGIAKIAALLFVTAGGAYTLYKVGSSIGGVLRNENFEFAIFIVTAFVLFFASIALALGEPEKEQSNPPSETGKI